MAHRNGLPTTVASTLVKLTSVGDVRVYGIIQHTSYIVHRSAYRTAAKTIANGLFLSVFGASTHLPISALFEQMAILSFPAGRGIFPIIIAKSVLDPKYEPASPTSPSTALLSRGPLVGVNASNSWDTVSQRSFLCTVCCTTPRPLSLSPFPPRSSSMVSTFPQHGGVRFSVRTTN